MFYTKFIISSLFFLIFLYGLCLANTDSSSNLPPARNETTMGLLKRDLLINYDKLSRPAEFNTSTKIDIGLTITHIDIDQEQGSMTLHGWVSMIWTDPKLVWDPKNYDNINEIHLPGHEIWQPDIGAYNSASENIDHYGNTLRIAKSNGQVIWVPPATLKVFCDLDFKFWPFDTQVCVLSLGAWSYSTNDIELNYDVSERMTELMLKNHEWSIKDISVSKETNNCRVKPFPSIKYELTLERRSPMFRTLIITPALVMIILTLSAFWLPPTSGEKILLNGILLIMICSFIIYFAQMLPILAVSTPLVVLFYSSNLVLVSISMIVSILVIFLAHGKCKRRVPILLQNLLNGTLGTILCLFHIDPPSQQIETQVRELQEENIETHITTDEEHPTIEQPSSKGLNESNWITVATALDRTCFLVYCIVFIVLAIIYSL